MTRPNAKRGWKRPDVTGDKYRNEHSVTHGASRGGHLTPTYITWMSMLQRCEYPRHKSYTDYGGRGIRVCDRWHVFENFLADMGEHPDGTTIDRKNPDGNYELENCRWATPLEQRHNRRRV
jgi:hypothetical protein